MGWSIMAHAEALNVGEGSQLFDLFLDIECLVAYDHGLGSYCVCTR